MSASFVLSSVKKDLLVRMRDPVAFAVWLGIPVLIITLMTLAFGGGGSGRAPQAHVLLVDEDDSFVSGLLARALSASSEEGQAIARVEKVAREEGRARIDAGEATALVIVPAGFGEAVLMGEPTTLELVKNPAQRILPGIVEEALSIVTDGVFYLQQVLGEPIHDIFRMTESGGVPLDIRVAAISVDINHRMNALGDRLFPPVIAYEAVRETEKEEDDGPGFGQLMFTSVLYMSLIFLGMGFSGELWQEHDEGTLRRLLVTPQGLAPFLLGKVLGAACVMALVALIAGALGVLAFGLPPMRLAAACVWASFSGTAFLVLFYVLQLMASGARGGHTTAMLLVFPLLMLGGSFFPFEAMPAWMASIGRWTPNGWSLVQFKAILAGDAAFLPLLAATAAILLFGAVAFTFCLRRLRAVAVS